MKSPLLDSYLLLDFIRQLPVKLFFTRFSCILLLWSLNTRQMAAACSIGRPNCWSSVENVVSSVWNLVAFTNKNRMHDIAALTDVRSFLLAMNDVFSLDSCIKVENVMNENYEIRMKSEMQKKICNAPEPLRPICYTLRFAWGFSVWLKWASTMTNVFRPTPSPDSHNLHKIEISINRSKPNFD